MIMLGCGVCFGSESSAGLSRKPRKPGAESGSAPALAPAFHLRSSRRLHKDLQEQPVFGRLFSLLQCAHFLAKLSMYLPCSLVLPVSVPPLLIAQAKGFSSPL